MNTHPRRFTRRLLGAVAGLALITAACGSDDSSTSTAPAVAETAAPGTSAPDVTAAADGGGGDGVDQRVVSLSPPTPR
jgi:hypothetical protein